MSRVLAYGAGFFLVLGAALSAYINSSFIQSLVGDQWIGWVYAAIALCSLLASWTTLAWVGGGQPRHIALGAMVSAAALTGPILYPQSFFAVVCLIVYLVATYLTSANLDIYLESLSQDRSTGRTRGVYLTAVNLAWLLSPWLSSQLISGFGYPLVYAVSLAALIPLAVISLWGLRENKSKAQKLVSLRAGLARVQREPDLRRILTLDLLLNFFYAIMVIYTPIYLHEVIGLPWTDIGVIFTIMLVPFVLLDLPLGYLADQWLGEKELLIFGLLVMSLACGIIASAGPIANVAFWATVLCLSRVGAATLEIMKETYLFKKINDRDANIVYLSRNMYPLSYLLAPLTASLFLYYFPLAALYGLLSLILLLGLPAALKLKDTK